MNIDIIGAGICGLTTALALEKKGYKPKIYEQAKELKPVGAGIILAANAMQVYRNLGLEEEIKSKGILLKSLNITDTNLTILSKVDLNYFKKKYDLQSVVIHRGKLQQILIDNLKSTKIHLEYKLEKLTKEQDCYIANFENGKTIKSSILLGADGIYSKVRNAINIGSEIRNSNQICWRGVTEFNLPQKYKEELNEAWGKGDRFAFVPFEKNKIYWYAVKSFNKNNDELKKEKIASYFKNYAPIVQDIITATPLSILHTATLEDLKPIKTWFTNNACLIGDAAHATTPNMGQGACQSIENAYVIAECLHKYKGVTAFQEYQKRRLKAAHKVVNQSRTIGKISHWEKPFAIYLRNKALTLVPKKMNVKQLDKLFQLKNYN